MNTPTLHESGLLFFKFHIFDAIKGRLSLVINDFLAQERGGNYQGLGAESIRQCIAIVQTLDNDLTEYVSVFETPFLNTTRQYVAGKSNVWFQEHSIASYLEIVHTFLENEKHMVTLHLHSRTLPLVMHILETDCLSEKYVEITNGCRAMLENDDIHSMKRMFCLLLRVEKGVEGMAFIFQEHVKSKGMVIVREESQMDLVKKLVHLHSKYFEDVMQHFEGHVHFQIALKNVFRQIVNSEGNKVAEQLCFKSDHLLSAGGDRLLDRDLHTQLDDVFRLFTYLDDKDWFIELYRQQLAKRLIQQRSESDENERFMISKMKLQCGVQFASKLEGMMNDHVLAFELNREFEEFRLSEKKGGIQFNVQMLTQAHWPAYRQVDCVIPPEFQECMDSFVRFYEQKTSGRRLQWQHSLGNAEVVYVTAKKNYCMQLTTLQAIVLRSFNSCQDQSFVSVQTQLEIPEDVLKRIFHSLAFGKYRVLVRLEEDGGGGGQGVKTTDRFRCNDHFQSTLRRFRIPMSSIEETNVTKKVEENRTHIIDASIVRIMKARKVMEHQQLMGEVIAQLATFRPEPKQIKKNIESLIEKEFLERHQENSAMYRYLA